MIDLHSHILPGIDDGAKTLEMSLEMARIAVADGIRTMACTPHIYPGLYMNDRPGVISARDALQRELDHRGIGLKLTTGADVHLVPGLIQGLRSAVVPTLNDSRYLLLEPPHHVAPPRLAESVFELIIAGYTPVITHPERLTYIRDHYDTFVEMTRQGAWMQVTAGSLTGVFGPSAKYWAERFLGDGVTHILASDAHSSGRRIPAMSRAVAVAERLVGRAEAQLLVQGRPQCIMDDVPAPQAPALPERAPRPVKWWHRVADKIRAH